MSSQSLAKPAVNTNLAENIYNHSPDLPSPHSSHQSSSASSTSSSAPSRSVNNMSSTSTSQSTPAPGSPLTEPSASPSLPPHAQLLTQAPNNPTHHQNNNHHHHQSTASVPPHSPLGTHSHSSNGFPTSSSSSSASSLLHKPTMVEHGICRFLIMDAPSPHNLPAVIDALKKRNCVCVVRVCEPTYSTDTIKAASIQHKDLPFADGDAPPPQVITEWMNLVRATFEPKAPTTTTTTPTVTDTTHDNSNGTNNHASSQKGCIGVHCVAGLGRAPVLVAVALVEYGMAPMDAVDFIRKRRRGAINAKQLKFLESYKPQSAPTACSCIIS